MILYFWFYSISLEYRRYIVINYEDGKVLRLTQQSKIDFSVPNSWFVTRCRRTTSWSNWRRSRSSSWWSACTRCGPGPASGSFRRESQEIDSSSSLVSKAPFFFKFVTTFFKKMGKGEIVKLNLFCWKIKSYRFY